jgi:predicted NBD/HSP70 family sugar kinase
VPVAVENDVIALAEAQRWFGGARDRPGFALVTIGVGVGYGLVVNGRVVRSREAGVSLAAHLRLGDVDRSCPLGHRGCASAMLATEAVRTRYVELGGSPASLGRILELASERDAVAEQVTAESADALGRFIALAANLSLQSTVVVAGDGVGLWSVAEQRIRDAAAAERDHRADPLHIVVDDTGFTAWARGAAVVAIQAAIAGLVGAGV